MEKQLIDITKQIVTREGNPAKIVSKVIDLEGNLFGDYPILVSILDDERHIYGVN